MFAKWAFAERMPPASRVPSMFLRMFSWTIFAAVVCSTPVTTSRGTSSSVTTFLPRPRMPLTAVAFLSVQ